MAGLVPAIHAEPPCEQSPMTKLKNLHMGSTLANLLN